MAPAPPFLPAPRIDWLIRPPSHYALPYIDLTQNNAWTKFWSINSPPEATRTGHPFYRIVGYYPTDENSFFSVSMGELYALDYWYQSVRMCLYRHIYNTGLSAPLAEEIVQELCAPQQFEYLAVIFDVTKQMLIEEGSLFSSWGEFRARSFLRMIGAIAEDNGQIKTLISLTNMLQESVDLLLEVRLQQNPEHRLSTRRGPVNWNNLGDFVYVGKDADYSINDSSEHDENNGGDDGKDNSPSSKTSSPVSGNGSPTSNSSGPSPDSSQGPLQPAGRNPYIVELATAALAQMRIQDESPDPDGMNVDRTAASISPPPAPPAPSLGTTTREGPYIMHSVMPGISQLLPLRRYDISAHYTLKIRFFRPSSGAQPMQVQEEATLEPTDARSQASGSSSNKTLVASNQPPGPAGFAGSGGWIFPAQRGRGNTI